MTHQEKLSFIREKCIEANPSIKDLIIGCKIEWENQPFTIINYGTSQYDKYEKFCNLINKSDQICDGDGIIKSPNTKIFGRDIRLADVLLAIEKNSKDSFFMIGQNGEFNQLKLHSGEEISSGIKYNFLKDNLTDQSEETIEFLYQLLK